MISPSTGRAVAPDGTTPPPTSNPPTSNPPTSNPPTSNPPTSTVTTSPPPTGSSQPCSAGYQLLNQWPGGFQVTVTVRAGTSAINGWTVRWTFPSGQAITQLWSGVQTVSGASVTVRNASYNGSVPPNGSTRSGFTGAYSGSNTAPTTITCTSP
jgi:cellulase/cellobiase CelA1